MFYFKFFFQVQQTIHLFSIFALIIPKIFTKYNAVWETEFLTIGHGRTEFEAYSSCEHYFFIRSGGLKFFCFVFASSTKNIYFGYENHSCLVKFEFLLVYF